MNSSPSVKRQAEEKRRPRSPASVRCVTFFAFIILYIPLVTVIIYSFLVPSDGYGSPMTFGFHWYKKLLQNSGILNAFWLSLGIAICCTIVSTFLGTILALGLERLSFKGKPVIHFLTLIPLLMPEIVMGLSLLIWFIALRFTLGYFSIVLAHITFSLSYVLLTVRARLKEFDQSFEEAAADLGATPTQVFWKVTFPLISPAVISGALLSFTLSFDDFLITFFTMGVGYDTLPVKLYSIVRFGISPEINALSSSLFFITFLLVMLVGRLK